MILADGQMEEEEETLCALVDASFYPISIIMIGVGDGPWGLMEDCDDLLPARKFDNFQVFGRMGNMRCGIKSPILSQIQCYYPKCFLQSVINVHPYAKPNLIS